MYTDKPVVCWDTETHLIGPYAKAPRLVCLQVGTPGTAVIYTRDKVYDEARRLLIAVIERRVYAVAHSAGYDLSVLAANYRELIPLIYDALDSDHMFCSYEAFRLLLRAKGELYDDDDGSGKKFGREERGSLALLAKKYLGLSMDKDGDSWRLRYAELEHVSLDAWPERAVRYAKDDVTVLRAVWLKLCAEADTLDIPMPGIWRTLPHETRSAYALSLMSAWGFSTREEYVDALEENFITKRNEAARTLWDAGYLTVGKKESLRSKLVQQRAEALGAMTLQPRHPKSNPKHDPKDIILKVTTEAWALRRTKDPLLTAVADYRYIANKVLGTYVPIFRAGVAAPIHCGTTTVQATGRTATYKPNTQNFPRAGGFRDCVVPHPGYVFCACDFNAAEMRSNGQNMHTLDMHSPMAEAFVADPEADLHLNFGVEGLLNLSLAEGLALKKAKDPRIKLSRKKAKTANFAFLGGMGAPKMSKNTEIDFWKFGSGDIISVDEAQDLKLKWIDQWDMNPYFDWVSSHPGIRDAVARFEVPGVGGWRGGCGFCAGANTPFQSLTAWGSKRALYMVGRACYDPTMRSVMFGSRPIIFAHDEVIVEMAEGTAPEQAEEMRRIMCAAFAEAHPDVPVRADAALMDRWIKDAEPQHDADGRLKIWEKEVTK